MTPNDKLRLQPVESPVHPNRNPSTVLRKEKGACCLCGKVGTWKGLDAYAIVKFEWRERWMTGTLDFERYRYIGWLTVLFCDSCFPESVIRESRERATRKLMYMLFVGLPAIVVAVFALLAFGAGIVAWLIVGLLTVLWVLFLVMHNPH